MKIQVNNLTESGEKAASAQDGKKVINTMSGNFASPSLQNIESPLKERLVGQKELANLIEKVKSGIFSRVEQQRLQSGNKAVTLDRSGHQMGIICEPAIERSQNSTEFISFAD